ncbi:hypothetical protein [Pengzhenrongella sp.]|jgi:DNA-directed RNA polymerase subunit M/transcription elongation factor TFIIS|uniref:hypothetical protein n=1 Tax=Pengzhenrongella sp. TaxID=2888820 RepID=UPI002F9218CC
MTRRVNQRSGAPTLPITFPTPDGAVEAARATNGSTGTVPAQRTRARAHDVPAPLGSIALAPARTSPGTTECGECGSTSLTHLQLTLADGSPVIFVSCHDCEHKAWVPVDGTGQTMSLEAVLGSSTRVR